MSAKLKLAVVKQLEYEAEFEKLLRQSAEYLKTRRPQLVPKTRGRRDERLT
jgi:hypothetical protein